MKHINFFTGASGVGKSTLINYLNNNYNIEAKEISARPYLPPGGSYDKTVTDEAQVAIVANRTLSVLEDVLSDLYTLTPYPSLAGIKPKIYSRSPIDNLAYQHLLGKTDLSNVILKQICEREVNIVKKYAHFFYIPIEFAMDPNDTVRGTNVEAQRKTDDIIINTLYDMNIPFTTIKGNIPERQAQLDDYFFSVKKHRVA